MRKTLRTRKKYLKAFSCVGAGERPHGFYTKQVRGVSGLGASLPTLDTCLGKTEAPLGCGDGLKVLEHRIYELAEAGDRKALRDAIREYVYLSLGGSLWR